MDTEADGITDTLYCAAAKTQHEYDWSWSACWLRENEVRSPLGRLWQSIAWLCYGREMIGMLRDSKWRKQKMLLGKFCFPRLLFPHYCILLRCHLPQSWSSSVQRDQRNSHVVRSRMCQSGQPWLLPCTAAEPAGCGGF